MSAISGYMVKVVMDGYLTGATCALYALKKKGTEIPGLTAATISFLAGRAIFKHIFSLVVDSDNKIKKVSESLGEAGKGVISYLAVSAVCSEWSLKNALLVTGLGVVASSIEHWRELHTRIKILPGAISHQVLAAGIVLTAACGLKHFGLIK